LAFEETVLFAKKGGKRMLDSSKDPDEELARSFIGSKDKEMELWLGSESGADNPALFAMAQALGATIRFGIRMLDHFERNNREQIPRRHELDYGSVCLPTLRLTFEDPEHPMNYYIGTIEGFSSVKKFLEAVRDAQGTRCSASIVLK